MKNCGKSQRSCILKILGNKNSSDAEIKEVIDIIRKTGATEYSSDYAKKMVSRAKNYLKKANLNGYWLDFFTDFSDYVIKRKE